MRVLFVNENLGGHRTMHSHLTEALAGHRDIEARFVHVPRPSLARRAIAVRWPLVGRYDLDFQPARAQLAAAHVARRLVLPLAAQADVIHWYTANSAIASLDLVARYPSVVSLDMTNVQNSQRIPYRDPTRFTPFVTRPVAALERRVYERADAVFAKSEWAAESVLVDYDVDPAKVRVHAFGILPGPPPSSPKAARPTIVFVGTTLERKGGHTLVATWRRTLRDRADLVLVTKDSVDPEPGLRVVNDLDGGDARLAGILERATVFAFPSTMDASPHAVFEAMARGLPAIVCRSGGMPEQVDDGATGFVIPPDDPLALAIALEKLVDDPRLARTMGRAARHAVETRFDMTKQIGPFLDVLREVAARR